ncbi:hypothetical protein TNCV_3933481 [Trichonephila clavipes]|nr:hypothetical protein TNCV_3933481 [Trichonephila clavipes]
MWDTCGLQTTSLTLLLYIVDIPSIQGVLAYLYRAGAPGLIRRPWRALEAVNRVSSDCRKPLNIVARLLICTKKEKRTMIRILSVEDVKIEEIIHRMQAQYHTFWKQKQIIALLSSLMQIGNRSALLYGHLNSNDYKERRMAHCIEVLPITPHLALNTSTVSTPWKELL